MSDSNVFPLSADEVRITREGAISEQARERNGRGKRQND
jgi:hypothetical protein